MDEKEEKRIADLLRVLGGPMSEGETRFLRGIQGFIDFAIRNGLSFHGAMAYLSIQSLAMRWAVTRLDRLWSYLSTTLLENYRSPQSSRELVRTESRHIT